MNLAACLHPDNFFHTSSDSKLSLPALQLASVLILVGLLPVLSSQLAVQQSIWGSGHATALSKQLAPIAMHASCCLLNCLKITVISFNMLVF